MDGQLVERPQTYKHFNTRNRLILILTIIIIACIFFALFLKIAFFLIPASIAAVWISWIPLILDVHNKYINTNQKPRWSIGDLVSLSVMIYLILLAVFLLPYTLKWQGVQNISIDFAIALMIFRTFPISMIIGSIIVIVIMIYGKIRSKRNRIEVNWD